MTIGSTEGRLTIQGRLAIEDRLAIGRAESAFRNRHFANRHFANRHFANRHFANRHFANRQSATRQLPNRQSAIGNPQSTIRHSTIPQSAIDNLHSAMAAPRAAISWSGGKDSLAAFAAARAHFEIVAALDDVRRDGSAEPIARTASGAGRRAGRSARPARRRARCGWDTYDAAFTAALRDLASGGITHVVFGDLVYPEHKAWAEARCADAGLTAVEPLFGRSTDHLLDAFVASGATGTDGHRARAVARRELARAAVGGRHEGGVRRARRRSLWRTRRVPHRRGRFAALQPADRRHGRRDRRAARASPWIWSRP